MSRFYVVEKQEYTCFKIIPHSSTRNYNTNKLAVAIANLYKSKQQLISIKEHKIVRQEPCKFTYIVQLSKAEICFYFICPIQYKELLKSKITEVWQRCKIEECGVPTIKYNTMYTAKYEKEDYLSLNVNRVNNNLLNGVLGTTEIMEADDQLTVAYNLVPTSTYGWVHRHDEALDRYKNGDKLSKEKDSKTQLVDFLYKVALWAEDFMCSFVGDRNASTQVEIQPHIPSTYSIKKKTDKILETQIAILSHSDSNSRSQQNAICVAEAFNYLQGDNRLKYERVFNKPFAVTSTRWKYIPSNKMSAGECHNLLQLPGRELMDEYNIEHNTVIETCVPADLQSGVMCIGESTYKDTTTKAYVSDDREYKYLTLVVVGPTRAGKTTLIGNLNKNAADAGEVNIVFDWIKACESSTEIQEALSKTGGRTLTIDCTKLETMQGLGYNELYTHSTNAFEVYNSAKLQTMQLLTLINSVQVKGADNDLQPQMERFVEAASIIVALQNGPIKDVYGVLQDARMRMKYINLVPENQKENCMEHIQSLLELNELNKAGEITGTKYAKVSSILNRFNKLKQNTYMEFMLKKDCENNINLIDEMQRPQTIFIKAPDDAFPTKVEKDLYATYWITKVWAALQKRGCSSNSKMLKVNLYFDELYQCENCQQFIKEKLSQIAKYRAKCIISCHYINQLKYLRDELRSASCSYMFLQRCDKRNYDEFAEELAPFGLQDLLGLKQHHSLNLMVCDGGYAKFITALPKPIVPKKE